MQNLLYCDGEEFESWIELLGKLDFVTLMCVCREIGLLFKELYKVFDMLEAVGFFLWLIFLLLKYI